MKYKFTAYVEQTARLFIKEELEADSEEEARTQMEILVQEIDISEYEFDLVEQSIERL